MAIEEGAGAFERADQTFLWLLRRNQVRKAAMLAVVVIIACRRRARVFVACCCHRPSHPRALHLLALHISRHVQGEWADDAALMQRAAKAKLHKREITKLTDIKSVDSVKLLFMLGLYAQPDP